MGGKLDSPQDGWCWGQTLWNWHLKNQNICAMKIFSNKSDFLQVSFLSSQSQFPSYLKLFSDSNKKLGQYFKDTKYTHKHVFPIEPVTPWEGSKPHNTATWKPRVTSSVSTFRFRLSLSETGKSCFFLLRILHTLPYSTASLNSYIRNS